ncbi:MAG: hypothetical protein HC882_02425 [Acidobacteria bacterium]|nr:hypothetical protein [Acidobacteriota bacterium]
MAPLGSDRDLRPPVLKEAVRIASLKIPQKAIRQAAKGVLRRLNGPTRGPGDFIAACEENASVELLAALRLADGLRSFASDPDTAVIDRMLRDAVGPAAVPWKAIAEAGPVVDLDEKGAEKNDDAEVEYEDLDADAQDRLASSED